MGFFSDGNDKRWSIESTGMTSIDSGVRGVALTFSDWSEAATLSGDERQAISDAQKGKKVTKLSASAQRKLIAKAKKAEKEAKKNAAKARNSSRWLS